MAREGQKVEIDGIWSTGEWLFHGEGWAAKLGLGKQLLDQENVTLRVIITREGGVRGERSIRQQHVTALLENEKKKHPARVEFHPIYWWQLNRILTLVRYPGSPNEDEAIYMKRRLARPTVSPYLVRGADGITYLKEVFESYVKRAALDSP